MKSTLLLLSLLAFSQVNSQEVSIQANGFEIKGTMLQAGEAKKIVALIIAGSGPTDRNCNSPGGIHTNAYKMLAEGLANEGISSLRFDKRWIGQSVPSGMDSKEVTLEDYIDDVRVLIDYLAAEGYERIVLIGHSEGSTIALAAALNNPKVASVVSLAGAGKPLSDVIVEQITAQSSELGEASRILMDSLVNGHTPKRIHPFLLSMFNPSAFAFLASYGRHDPAVYASKLTQPLMIVNGTTDIQVGVEQAELLKSANSKATYRIYDGMNHVLKAAPTDRMQNIATYSNPDLPLFDGLVSDITSFIKSL